MQFARFGIKYLIYKSLIYIYWVGYGASIVPICYYFGPIGKKLKTNSLFL